MSHTEGKLIYFIDDNGRTVKFVKTMDVIDILLRGITKKNLHFNVNFIHSMFKYASEPGTGLDLALNIYFLYD